MHTAERLWYVNRLSKQLREEQEARKEASRQARATTGSSKRFRG